MAVGRICVSPSEGTGISSGTPPASHTPRLTCSATSPRWLLHGLSSDHVVQIAMCGRPSNACGGRPRRIQARWMNPSRSALPYQAALRLGTVRHQPQKCRAVGLFGGCRLELAVVDHHPVAVAE